MTDPRPNLINTMQRFPMISDGSSISNNQKNKKYMSYVYLEWMTDPHPNLIKTIQRLPITSDAVLPTVKVRNPEFCGQNPENPGNFF
jgi:hypothetical protein